MNDQSVLAGLNFILPVPSEDPAKTGLWHGHIIAQISDTAMLVQLFDWDNHSPTVRRIVAIGDMAQGELFEDMAEFLTACDKATTQPEEPAGIVVPPGSTAADVN